MLHEVARELVYHHSTMSTDNVLDPVQIMQSQQEQLIQVDSNNVIIGSVGKIAAHQGGGILHRAFTAFLFDDKGNTLITKRSVTKPLWPDFWDGACSSHQWFPDESAAQAAVRRIPFELGINLDRKTVLTEYFTYEYHVVYSPEWSENEINSIVVGSYTGECTPNSNEVAAYEWVEPSVIAARLKATSSFFAPWFKMAWEGMLARDLINKR